MNEYRYRVLITYDQEKQVYLARAPELEKCTAEAETAEAAMQALSQEIEAQVSNIKEAGHRVPTPVDEEDFDAFARLQDSKRVLNIPRYPGNTAAGERLYRRECASCHGAGGYGERARSVPQLAGQHSLYLKRQVETFRRGERLHDDPRDAETFRAFSDTEIDDILAFLSVLDDYQGAPPREWM